MFFPVSEWFPAFLLTLAVELPVGWLLLRRHERGTLRLLAIVIFANLATHPAVWFVFTQLFLVGTPAYLVAAEGWALVAETLLYLVAIRGLPLRLALGTSLVANVASFVVGGFLLGSLPEVFR